MNPQVLVVGAGPTGLTAALLLAREGVSVRVIDRAAVRSDKSRALAVQARTLELLDSLGLADELVSRGHPAPATNLYADGERVLRVSFAEHMPKDTRFPMLLFVSQVEVERLLEDALSSAGVTVERPVELVSFREEEGGIVAQLRGEREERVHADYVIGADGAHSTVRHQLELPFDGAAYAADFMLADLVVDAHVPTDELQVFLGRTGLCVLFPLPGRRTRLITTEPEVVGELTLDRLTESAAGQVGRRWSVEDCVWLARFRLHHRGVPHYQVGRAFVAGDAAHIHSPLGGQGMNTGMQDAWNLAWKLIQVLRHHAPSGLLTTYDEERRPVGVRLLSVTDRAFVAASAGNTWVTGLRNLVLPWVAPQVATAAVRDRAVGFVSQTGIRYRGSSLNRDLDRGVGPRPGDRIAEPALAGRGWTLLAWGTEPWYRRRLEGLTGLVPWVSLRWVDPRHGCDAGMALVRPDGHLALRASGTALDPLSEYLAGMGLG